MKKISHVVASLGVAFVVLMLAAALYSVLISLTSGCATTYNDLKAGTVMEVTAKETPVCCRASRSRRSAWISIVGQIGCKGRAKSGPSVKPTGSGR